MPVANSWRPAWDKRAAMGSITLWRQTDGRCPCLFSIIHLQASEEPEERETLALMAARGDSEETQDGETYIEKYTRGVLEVENILSLEKLRQVPSASQWRSSQTCGLSEWWAFLWFLHQAVTVKEALAAKGRHLRRSLSTPNVLNVMQARE